MVEPLTPEEEAAYRKSVAFVTERRIDDWTESAHWVRRLLATLDAARETPADLADDLHAAEMAAWVIDAYIHAGPVLSSTEPPSRGNANDALATIRKVIRAAGVRAAPPSEDAARLREALVRALDASIPAHHLNRPAPGMLKWRTCWASLDSIVDALATPAVPTEPTPCHPDCDYCHRTLADGTPYREPTR